MKILHKKEGVIAVTVVTDVSQIDSVCSSLNGAIVENIDVEYVEAYEIIDNKAVLNADKFNSLKLEKEQLSKIDLELDSLKKRLLHNETYKNEPDYQQRADDILNKISKLRNDRRALTNG